MLQQDAFTETGQVQVNPSRDKVTTDFSNVKINSDNTAQIHNEEQIWMNPLSPQNLIAVWRDFRLGYRRVGVGRSSDGGDTWTGALFTGTPYEWDSDPGIVCDADGNFYMIILTLNNSDWRNGIYVAKSTDNGASWSGGLAVDAPDATYFEDKELLACDRTSGSGSGNLYISWTRFEGYYSYATIYSVRSTDGGASWSSPVQVSSSRSTQWSVPVVGADGTLWVGWNDFNNPGIWIDHSTDHGLSFGTDDKIFSTQIASGDINDTVLVFSYPAMDADITGGPYNGNLYIAFMDDRGNGDMDIYFTRSTDNGITWSTPVRVNDDPPANGRDQFHPWLFVDNTGKIHLAFYDRRDDPSNYYYNVYYTSSTDGGLTWAANRRVSSESSAPVANKGGVLGEYFGVAGHDGKPYICWTDTREGHQRIYFGTDTTNSGVDQVVHGPDRVFLAVNPTVGKEFTVSYVAEQNQPLSLEIYDQLGVRVKVLKPTAHRGTVSLSAGELEPGVYTVIMKSVNRTESATFVVR